MRRSAILAVALLLAAAAPAQARVASVTGTYTYGGAGSTVEIEAYGTDPVSGSFHYSNDFGGWFDGDVLCVTVEGSDAWVAGLVTAGTTGTWAVWFGARLHDGGSPGTSGDMAITMLTHNSLMHACETATITWERNMVPITDGNLFVRDSK